MKNKSTGWVIVLAAIAVPSEPAFAQKAELEEVIVTAQKREERLIDVPMSIAALSGAEIERRGLTSIQDLSFAVPGMAMREDGPGSYTIFMRGLSNQYGEGALVGVYLDEAPLSLTGFDQLDSRLLDLERVEVLKGPQGTLYGQGSVAGAVRYITKAPVLDEFSGTLEATGAVIADGDTKEVLTGIVNLPLVKDRFGLRIAATVEEGGGWQDQPQAGIEDGNNQDLVNVRAKALWKATDALDVQGMLVVHRNESELGLGYENEDRTITVGVDRSKVLVPKEFDYNLYSLNVNYDFGGAQLLSASTFIDHDHQYPFSYIGGPQTLYGGLLEGNDARFIEAQQFSQEVRLVSAGETRLNWTVGGFYRSLDRDLFAVFDTLFAGVITPATVIENDTYDSFSLFADASYGFTDRFKAGVGVRYFEDDQSTFDGFSEESDTFDSVDPRVYASFAVSTDLNVYASVAKGFRSGGFNRGDLPNYDPESLVSYEIGAKGSVIDRLVDFEVAAYYSDYSDMLRRGLVFVPSTARLESLTGNVGDVEVMGIEGGVTLRATDRLTLNATGAYIDSEVKEVRATDATNIAGDPVDYVPELSFTLGAHYEFEWTAQMPGFARLNYSYRDKVSYVDRTSFPTANLPQSSDTLGLLDARIGLAWKSTTFELFGSNLTDENKWIDPYTAWSNANRTRPRTVGLKVGFNFN